MIGIFLFTQLLTILIVGLEPNMDFKDKLYCWFFITLIILLIFIISYCLANGI